jgi:hypothetical protein
VLGQLHTAEARVAELEEGLDNLIAWAADAPETSASQADSSLTEVRSYAWTAPKGEEIHLTDEDVRREHDLPAYEELTEAHWDQSVRNAIGGHGGPPAASGWPTEIRRTR